MGKSKYYCILERNGMQMSWKDRAESKSAFLTGKIVKGFVKDGWTVKESGRCSPETKREKPWCSLAFVDMGQAATD